MQSIPPYYASNYPPTSPYPNNNVNTTVTTSSPGTGSTVMTIANPPILSANVMSPMNPTILKRNDTGVMVVKRNQVKNACTNCQKACKKCDDARPCPRCIKYGISDTCINSVRKERKKGIKRGPYKRRQKSGEESKSSGEKMEYRNNNVVMANDTNTVNTTTTAAAVAAVVASDYGYPSNLTQYAQAYDPYHYAATATAVYNNSKDQQQNLQQQQQNIQQQQHVYIVTPGYSNFPVLVDGNTTNEENSNENNSNNNTGNGTYFNIQSNGNGGNGSPVLNSGPPPAPGVYYQTSSSASSSNPVGVVEQDVKQEKHQPMTPVPSTSNSSGTTSPSETPHDDDEEAKFSRLTQLCSAALRENKEAEEAKTNKAIKEEEN